ncbi:MAG: hypothetical protein EZS28_027742 [Streblomastix strix]|uniref:Uncharacterized protein n=1 Tax=Streblomastix strix TaxID=222440 RepID=A0A5J4V2Z7_9EUKA|nr:MAG: hypothetical protein EZS28_027742 [Streblomastix strix]
MLYTQEILHVLFHNIMFDEFDSKQARKIEEHEAIGNRILERQTIHNALIDREIKLTRREVNILMRSLKRKYPDKAIDANDAAKEPFELPFETHEANLLQFPSNRDVSETQNGLFLADLGLAKLQTHTLLRLLADLKMRIA